MKRTLYLILLLAGLLAGVRDARAQCTTLAGTLATLPPASLCESDNFSVAAAGDAVLDADDVLLYVVADTPGLPLGTVLATSTDGAFDYSPVFSPGVTYYVFAAAGNDDGSGGIDWSDPCLSASPAAPVAWQPLPVAIIDPPGILNCFMLSQELNATASSAGPQYAYAWSTTGGSITSGSTTLTPVIDGPGTYCLLVTDIFTGCTASACVQVEEDVNIPVASAGTGLTLTCNVTTIQLDGTPSSTGPQFVYIWSTVQGNIVSGANTLTPVVSDPGVYCVTVVNTANGCSAEDCVTITQDVVAPSADAGPDQVLTCFNLQVTIPASGSGGPALTYLWSGPGIFANNMNLLNPTVNQPGVYCLTVTNEVNGCTAQDCVIVQLDATPPSVSASATPMSCSSPQTFLTASAVPPNAVFSWLGPLGFTFSGPTAVAWPGLETTYTVTATNTVNGCTATTEVSVLGDSTMPRVDAVLTPEQCDQGDGSISLTPNPPGQPLTYEWSNGQIGPQATNLGAGSYFVTITDTQSGCTKAVLYQIQNQGLTVTADVTPVSCSGGANGAISLQVSGGSPDAFAWSGPNGFTATTPSITGLQAGIYNFTITDAGACTTTGFVVVNQPAPITIPTATLIVTNSCTNTGAINISPIGGTLPYTFSWNNGQTVEDINGLPPGLYTVTITDAVGCNFVSQQISIQAGPPALVSSFVSNSTCDENGSIVLTSGIPGVSMIYQWSNGSSSAALTSLSPGFYSVTITNPNSGCTAVQNFDILLIGAGPCAVVKGRVVLDSGQDCLADAGEDGLPGWIVEAVGQDTFYAATNAGGEFSMGLLPGDYVVQAVLPNALWIPCAALPVSLVSPDDTVTVDLPVQADILCPALTVDLSTPLLRRCFSNNFYYVNYCNEGPTEAADAYVLLTLDPFITPLTASLPYTALGNNVFRFNIGTVASGDCGTFWVKVSVSCSAVLGQTHCSEAHIFPDTLCDSDANWSGASLVVNAVCDGDSVRFSIKNAGAGPMSTSLDYIVIEDGIMLMQAGGPPLAAGDSAVVAVPANGATWRVEAMQEPFHPDEFLPAAVVEGCTVTGSFSTGYVNQFSNYDAGPALDVDCTANIGSYDPNDKQGFPLGYGPSHYVRPGANIEYLIRFQNTGTDTAFTVVVRDTLSGWLDPATAEPGASSHAYHFDLSGEGVVIFTFENILLPDSNVNEAASHGFVRFRIAQKTDVPLETDIFNRAAIYFDFNDPVLTNTTVHRIGVNFIATGIFTPEQADTGVRISPNPFEALAAVELAGYPDGQRLRVGIFNGMGRLVRQQTASAPRFTLDATGLPQGVYVLKIEAPNGRGRVAKFIVY